MGRMPAGAGVRAADGARACVRGAVGVDADVRGS